MYRTKLLIKQSSHVENICAPSDSKQKYLILLQYNAALQYQYFHGAIGKE